MTMQVVILAAGQGTRMRSALPKVLHTLGGKTLLGRVIETARQLSSAAPIVVCGHQASMLQNAFSDVPIQWILQKEQQGTGHALLQALPHITADHVLVLYGDVPLVSVETLKQLTATKNVAMLTAVLANPTGYGRIKRDANHQVIGIVEEKDATAEEKKITEINSGMYVLPTALLKKHLPLLKNTNAQKEYYLTDMIACAAQENRVIDTVHPKACEEVQGVNDRVQLAALERYYQRDCAEALMRSGVTVLDPLRLDIRGEVTVGRDTTIDVNVILEGCVSIGEQCVIGPNVVLRNVTIGDHVEIKANSIIEDAQVAADCRIGPYARIRPGTVLAVGCHIGNFVEVKNSEVGAGTKINHLSYIGDSQVGQKVNIGAGTITCNYDGVNKHKTIIQDNVFVGSSTQLIAPVTVGEGATIGAGSTITSDVPPQQLTLSRTPQQTIKHWQRPVKTEKSNS